MNQPLTQDNLAKKWLATKDNVQMLRSIPDSPNRNPDPSLNGSNANTKTIRRKLYFFVFASIVAAAVFLLSGYIRELHINSPEVNVVSKTGATPEKLGEDGESKISAPPLGQDKEELVEQDNEKLEGLRAMGVAMMLSNEYAIEGEEFDELFERHTKSYPDIDGDSAYQIFRLAMSCTGPLSFRAATKSHLESGVYNDEEYQYAMSLGDGRFEACDRLVAIAPEGADLNEWAHELLEKAADAGSKEAILISEWTLDDTQSTYEQTAANLEQAVRSGDATVMHYAADFYETFHHPDGIDTNFPDSYKWRYLACVQSQSCDENLALRLIATAETINSGHLAIIETFAEDFPERAKDPEPFGFANGRLPFYLYQE